MTVFLVAFFALFFAAPLALVALGALADVRRENERQRFLDQRDAARACARAAR